MRTKFFLALSMAMALSSLILAQENEPIYQERERILYTLEQQKLARDLYVAVGQHWNSPVFQQLISTEQSHLEQLIDLANLYKLNLPNAILDDQPGVFDQPKLQEYYNTMLSEASKSLVDAYKTAAWVEEMNIVEMDVLFQKTDEVKVLLAYDRLIRASTFHLRLFVRSLKELGIEYKPVVLPKKQFQELNKEHIQLEQQLEK